MRRLGAASMCRARASHRRLGLNVAAARCDLRKAFFDPFVAGRGTNVGPVQHQFTDALYGTVGSGNLEKTVVVDGVVPP
ncbi:MAG TPA: hypothetical protein VND98_04515 [Solirubrobacterales bacterium]|nr:hypothetical protein [Solirubrobacterales bacterium]